MVLAIADEENCRARANAIWLIRMHTGTAFIPPMRDAHHRASPGHMTAPTMRQNYKRGQKMRGGKGFRGGEQEVAVVSARGRGKPPNSKASKLQDQSSTTLLLLSVLEHDKARDQSTNSQGSPHDKYRDWCSKMTKRPQSRLTHMPSLMPKDRAPRSTRCSNSPK